MFVNVIRLLCTIVHVAPVFVHEFIEYLAFGGMPLHRLVRPRLGRRHQPDRCSWYRNSRWLGILRPLKLDGVILEISGYMMIYLDIWRFLLHWYLILEAEAKLLQEQHTTQ